MIQQRSRYKPVVCASVLLGDTSSNETWHVQRSKYSTAGTRHSTAQHRTVPHSIVPHGRARRRSAEIALRCATELVLANPVWCTSVLLDDTSSNEP